MPATLLNQGSDQIKLELPSAVWAWRKTVFERIFSILSLICIPVYITSVYLCIKMNYWELVIFDTFVYATFVSVAFGSIIPLKIRFTIGCAITYLIGVAFLLVIGPSGAGFFWLFIYPLLSCVLLGNKAGYIAQVINFFTLAVIGLLFYHHVLQWPEIEGYSFFIWCVVAINFMVTNILAMSICGYLLQATAKHLKQVQVSRYAFVVGLATLSESYNPSAKLHIHRVAMYVQILAVQLANTASSRDEMVEKIDDLMLASMLHDVGMREVPERLLCYKGKMSLDNFEDIKRHCVSGASLLKSLQNYHPNGELLFMARDIALYHHENWDGSGYPQNVMGTLIPLSARLMRLVDVYDGMTSERSYQQMMGHNAAVEFIKQQSGILFDPNVVNAFLLVTADFAQLNPNKLAIQA
ncbi:HD-GYP domain-containing protein [Shewanella sp. OMA3-2]|uniref:HD-GYP domain-containing protein n=1 Tax=Shewanella sp. OMA3-2 TaxID=2908650 RepID=UPI001F1C232C|nr:HD domain-containing phosphohydrolase [Shewanella sp. OMA3-2]UJF20468.1 HD domain-containing protein [Shewanella sp. OMA3-2]